MSGNPILWRALPVLLLGWMVAPAAAGTGDEGQLAPAGLVPRQPLVAGPVLVLPLPAGTDRTGPEGILPYRLVVKFGDAVRARSTPTGELVSAAGAELSELQSLARREGLRFSPLIALPEGRLSALEARAAARSGRAQPDLAGMQVVELPKPTVERLENVGRTLQDLAVVEFVHVESLGLPPPGDIAPPTPDLIAQQGYRGPDPGVDVDYAWGRGLRGAGIRLSDCEYGWNPDHEDFNDIDLHTEPGQTIPGWVYSNGWDSHGTAVLGEAVAVDNGYGVSGLAPDSLVYTYPEWSNEQGGRRVTSITNAIAGSALGDVVLLEMQANGAGGDFGPAELDPAVFTVVKAGTDAGVVVVGAAGNGAQDLDSAPYIPYMGWGDSGAILVGAGTASTSHNKIGFSTYGSRVNVQGWGTGVFSTGYGSYAAYGGDKNQRYTSSFSGTSSASPFVAAVCCLVQQRAVEVYGAPLAPATLRQLLVDTGTPQGTGGHIGPLPDLRAAVRGLPFLLGPWSDLQTALAGAHGKPFLSGVGPLSAGSPVAVLLEGALENAAAILVVGLSRIDVPLKGGVLVPAVDVFIVGLFTDATGDLAVNAIWPAGVPSGTETFYQTWVTDAAGPDGFAASNAITAITP